MGWEDYLDNLGQGDEWALDFLGDGFFALSLHRQGLAMDLPVGECVANWLAGWPSETTTRPAVRNTPGGAQVASPQSPILRWSKERGLRWRAISRFRFQGGV